MLGILDLQKYRADDSIRDVTDVCEHCTKCEYERLMSQGLVKLTRNVLDQCSASELGKRRYRHLSGRGMTDMGLRLNESRKSLTVYKRITMMAGEFHERKTPVKELNGSKNQATA